MFKSLKGWIDDCAIAFEDLFVEGELLKWIIEFLRELLFIILKFTNNSGN